LRQVCRWPFDVTRCAYGCTDPELLAIGKRRPAAHFGRIGISTRW